MAAANTVGTKQLSSTLRILVIEDDLFTIDFYRRNIDKKHDLFIATSGRRGKDILERDTAFDVIFCDILMPDITGIQLYDWLSEYFPEIAMKFVFITGVSGAMSVSEFLHRIPNIWLKKPFVKKQIDEILENFLKD